MSSASFDREWRKKVEKVRASAFWREVSGPPLSRIECARAKPKRSEAAVDGDWGLGCVGDLAADGPGRLGLDDLKRSLRSRFGVRLRSGGAGPRLVFELVPKVGATRWDGAFDLRVDKDLITVRAPTEAALLRASLFLTNYWSLRRNLYLPIGRRAVRPRVELHLGADLWGGFSTTQAWVHGRENDDNFLELARMGVNGVPVMALLEDYLDVDPASRFGLLHNPCAAANRKRLAALAHQAARAGVHIFLMAYNPKLAADHPLFERLPGARGALQAGGFRPLCTSDPGARRFLVEAWTSLFAEIPELGGVMAITGGEGFYHCFMRSETEAADCPRCSRRSGSEVVAELVNDVAAGIRSRCPEARLVTWPYSAGHWSHDRDQVDFINRLDPEHVVFQTEVDKDSVDWRSAGYAKNVWDYSLSKVTASERCRIQRRLCAGRRLPFSVKIEASNSIECLNVPYLPVLENQRRIWENAVRLRPRAIHSRWLFDGSCKSPSEELGFWAIWGRGTEFADLGVALMALARRDFGGGAGQVCRAWTCFSEGLRHHPQLDYYVGPYFIGPGQPLVLDPDRATQAAGMDPAFFGRFFWLWETSETHDQTAFLANKPLFYSRPGFQALARRGPRKGQDVALEELQAMAAAWELGVRSLERAKARVSSCHRKRFQREYILGRHLAYTWRSAANVEEFLRLRDLVRAFSGQSWVRAGHIRENLRDVARMERLARAELDIARRDLVLVRGVDFLDLDLRMDMGTASTVEILEAKIRQVQHLLADELPAWRETLRQW